jgi:undecaprenyl-diphosphatase
VTLWQAIVLGLVQGLGEFLPISSSGHLIVVPWLLGWAEQSLAFDVALHLGTLVAVLGAFAGDWRRLVTGAWRGLRRGAPLAAPEGRLLGLLALASIPGGVVGLLLDHWAETVFRAPVLVASTMALMGGVLWLADRHAAEAEGDALGIGLRDALLIGAAQAFAIVPGVSRSGATISMGLFLGYRRQEAARFSFLLATPITAGAALVKVPKLLAAGGDLLPVLVGMLVAGLAGWLSIKVLLGWVRTRSYAPFVVYRLLFALLVFALAAWRS